REAVRLVGSGTKKSEVARRLGRSREWVHKWVNRFVAEGEAGLGDRSRAPRSSSRIDDATVAAVLDVRAELEADPVASICGESILATMERRGFAPLPSVASSERNLDQAGVTRPYQRHQRSGNKRPSPQVPSAGIWQQVDWIQDRWLEGG